MLLPQLRGYKPLRVGHAQIAINQQIMLAIFAALMVFAACFHFFGPSLKGAAVAAWSSTTLPRYWSVSGKGSFEGVVGWKRPEGLKIVGLVFYGRPASVSILDCYLRRNLVANGGLLDEVIFLARTKKEQDLEWLDELITQEPAYKRENIKFHGKDYASAYDVIQNGTMYVKIDDDIVFMEDTAIPTIVRTKLEHPEYFIVSANIMNQPTLSWVHHHLGVIKPYMPELEKPDPNSKNASQERTWRASTLPIWKGPKNFTVGDNYDAPYEGHRWLPMEPGTSIDETPISNTKYDAFSPGLWHWTIAAQEHYSFFEHLEKNDLWKYKFHKWDYKYRRMGIQFVAIMGEDINLSKPLPEDDEWYFTEVMPKMLQRHAIVDGRALVAHYSFLPQREGIASTDILDRYRAYAQENICH